MLCAGEAQPKKGNTKGGKGGTKGGAAKPLAVLLDSHVTRKQVEEWATEGTYWGPGVRNVRVRTLASDVDARYRVRCVYD